MASPRRALIRHSAVAALIGTLFTYWIWQAGAIGHARSCPDTCLTHVAGEVTATSSSPSHSGQDGRETGGTGHSATIALSGGRTIEVSLHLSAGDDVDVGLWHGTPVTVDRARIPGSAWPESWYGLVTIPLFAALVYAALTAASELVVWWRGGPPAGPGCLPPVIAVLSLPLSMLAVGFTNLSDGDWFPRWWPAPLLIVLGLPVVIRAITSTSSVNSIKSWSCVDP
ncbi:hypothetical protein [Actinoplanes rectilineatus]|uniref:hypothetical protein n=1 Tax=Actinoplanes rectilineatus TaxID=113571 RepID=UPI0005F2F55C|nr:hypothetical protein [Actinoplanes rectilineatus]